MSSRKERDAKSVKGDGTGFYSLFTILWIPSLKNTLLKLINKPSFLFDSLRYVRVWAKWTGAKWEMDFISTITRFSTSRSNLYPTPCCTSLYTNGMGTWLLTSNPGSVRSWINAASYTDSNKPGPKVRWIFNAAPIIINEITFSLITLFSEMNLLFTSRTESNHPKLFPFMASKISFSIPEII